MVEVRKKSVPTVTGKSNANDNVLTMWYNMDAPIVGVQASNQNDPGKYSSFGPYHESIPIKYGLNPEMGNDWSRSFRGSVFNTTT